MNEYKLSLLSKRLKSGKCQIKFTISDVDDQIAYGYLLSEAGTTLKEVVYKIEREVKGTLPGHELFHPHLYNLQQKKIPSEVIIFKR